MEMHQVRYFLAMARTLNFTRAAEDCNVTQPSLTRAIQKLEEELGGPLFRRERSRTHLTDLGRLMLPHLGRTYEAAEAAKALAQGVGKAEIAPLSLGVAAAIESEDLQAILGQISAGLPGFQVNLVSGSSESLLELALAGGLDLLLIEAPDERQDRLETWPLFDHLYQVVTRADHPLAARTELRVRDFAGESWIDYGGDGARRLSRLTQDHGFDPDFRHKADSFDHLKRLVCAGLGSAFAPGRAYPPPMVALNFSDAQISGSVVVGGISGRRRSTASDAFLRAARARDWASAV